MEPLTRKEIKSFAKNILGLTQYHEEFSALHDDVQFFDMYMKRNKKSSFYFEVRINVGSSSKLFNMLYERYNRDISYLEDVFAEYIVLKEFINDIYNQTTKFSIKEKKALVYYFDKYDDFKISSVIGDIINCSLGCSTVRNAIELLKTA